MTLNIARCTIALAENAGCRYRDTHIAGDTGAIETYFFTHPNLARDTQPYLKLLHFTRCLLLPGYLGPSLSLHPCLNDH